MFRGMLHEALGKFPRAAQFLRNSRDLLDRQSPVRETPWGFSLAGHEAMAAGTLEPEETALIRRLLQEVDVLGNVGANVGYYCCHALSLGKPVIAVEPIARNLYYLLENMRNNGWKHRAEVFFCRRWRQNQYPADVGRWRGRFADKGLGIHTRKLCDAGARIDARPSTW